MITKSNAMRMRAIDVAGSPYEPDGVVLDMLWAADKIERLREELSLIAVMGYSTDLNVSARIGHLAVERAQAALKEPEK